MAASGNALVDTSAILAILDRRDIWHVQCRNAFHQLSFPLLTSEAVLTELFHLADRSRIETERVWGFVRSGAIVLGPIENAELPALHALMSLYADQPMDFADATLVHLANRESVTTILTVDQAHFETYRLAGKRRFQVLPLDRP
jgi:predicted nucleic acid-binding protein